MSLQEYQTTLPGLFPGSNENEESGMPKTQRKGVAHIIEYHKETLQGREVEIIPADQLVRKTQRKATKQAAKYEDYTLVLRRTWVLQRNLSIPIRVELEIQSENLCNAFREIAIDTYQDTDLHSFPIKLKSPFAELFFYREKIKSLAQDENNDPGLRREAELLHDFVQGNPFTSSIIQDHEKYSKGGHVMNDILWTIYPPNSLVVVTVGMIRECWICRNVSIKLRDKAYFWDVTGLRIGFDGSSVGLVEQTFNLPLTGMQVCKISDLPVVPIEHCRDWNQLKDTLMARSTRLQKVLGTDLSSFSSQTYAGPALSKDFSFYLGIYNMDSNPMSFAKQIDERVIVDFKAFIDRHREMAATLEDFGDKLKAKSKVQRKPKGRFFIERDASPKRIRERDLEPGHNLNEKRVILDPEDDADPMAVQVFAGPRDIEDTPKSNLEDLIHLSEAVADSFNISKEDFQLLFPALVPGFGLKEKEWRWVLSDEFRDVQWNRLAFESLQLEDETKGLVQALVKGHQAKSTVFDDVMPGKGQGLVFLLHGKPGLGKTLTAESVADYLKQPLYSISGGELSTDVTILETRLNEIFDLTKRWNAVSLLDEADVLLCKRNSAEIDRNAIVAVFLRKIEYFQGVLFLTTNRKEDFDEAFKSRIHVTISYSDLTEKARSAIWKKLIEANEKVDTGGSWTDGVFTALGKLDLNGRTIKNILRTAVAYASADGSRLEFRHVLAIIKTELKDEEVLDEKTVKERECEKKRQTEETLQHLQGLVEISQSG